MKKILVIEDNTILRDNMTEVLRLEGYRVIEAADGADGVRLAQQELPDLVLCDVHLPGLGGQEVVETLRQDAQTAKIPFIIMTADPNLNAIRSRLDLQMDDLVSKPFDVAALLQRVHQYLSV
jgi:CheY-like chemotaxis protein